MALCTRSYATVALRVPSGAGEGDMLGFIAQIDAATGDDGPMQWAEVPPDCAPGSSFELRVPCIKGGGWERCRQYITPTLVIGHAQALTEEAYLSGFNWLGPRARPSPTRARSS